MSVLLFACVAVIALASGTSLRVMLASFGKFHEALHNQSVAEMYAEMGERATQAYEKSKGMASTAAKVYSEAKSTLVLHLVDDGSVWRGRRDLVGGHDCRARLPDVLQHLRRSFLSNATNETLDNEMSLEALFGGGGNDVVVEVGTPSPTLSTWRRIRR